MLTNEFSDVIERVQGWPAAMRISLARQILETLETKPPTAPAIPRGPTAAEVAAMFKADQPAPSDQTIRQWVDEHRMTKYGQ